MHYIKSAVLSTLLSLFFYSCSLFNHNKSIHHADFTPQDSMGLKGSGVYRATATKYWELVHTTINIGFDIKGRTATATTELLLHPKYYDTDSVVLDARSMEIISVGGKNGQAYRYSYDSSKISIRLPKTFSRFDTLSLSIRYIAKPYWLPSRAGEAIADDKGLYFINADGLDTYKPVQIWTQGETESNSHWFPTFDHPNFRSSFTLNIQVPDSLVTLSNGVLKSQSPSGNGLRTDTWVQEKPIPPYLVMMAIGDFFIARDSAGVLPVDYYVPRAYAQYAKNIFAHTPEMITFYSQLLGVPYPWDKYSQVAVYEYTSGAMENVSASLFGAFNLKDNRELADSKNDYIVAHELFHQWFGDYVTAESWSNISLNESFADYGEYIWTEYKYGAAAAAEELRKSLDKYLTQAAQNDPPLLRYYYNHPDNVFDRVSYSKGGLILHYLRQLIGDKAFFESLRLYLTRHALSGAEVAQLRIAIEDVTGKDWHWFFDQWFARGGHPELLITYNFNDAEKTATISVQQKQGEEGGIYKLPLEFRMVSGEGSRTELLGLNQANQSFRLRYPGAQRPLIIADAGNWLPGTTYENKSKLQWYAQYDAGNFSQRLAVVDAMVTMKQDDSTDLLLLSALSDKDDFIRLRVIERRGLNAKLKGGLRERWLEKLLQIAGTDASSRVRAAAIEVLGELRDKKYLSVYEMGLGDQSYRVSAAALIAVDKAHHSRALEWVRGQSASPLFNQLEEAKMTVLAKEGLETDYALFESQLKHAFEGDRIALLSSFVDYMLRLDDEAEYKNGLNLISSFASHAESKMHGLATASAFLQLKKEANTLAKISNERTEVEMYRLKAERAANAWNTYKLSVKDPELKSRIAAIEKEM